jgi:hypothetical protein
MKLIGTVIFGVVLLFTGCQFVDTKSDYGDYHVESVLSNILKIYKSGSNYESVLIDCVSKSTYYQNCSLNKLPLLGMEITNPTKEDILKRVVVSDNWMGDNFATMLDYLPDDMKKLFGAVTAIVISRDIIPSYYDSYTGAIYIDPRYLWFTPIEAETIIPNSDFRDEYGKSLQFISAWRYVKDNSDAIKYYSLDSGVSRTPEDVKLALSRLLYHELAHAKDFASNLDRVDRDKPIGDAFEEYNDSSLSAKMDETYPLKDEDLKSLAKILYMGSSSNSYFDSLSPSDVGLKFEKDGANDLYGFNNRFEDFAMLFEETMMRYHYGIERDVAFVGKDSSYTIGWGERNRVADESVKERAKFVAKSLVPDEVDWDMFFQSDVGESQKLRNVGWFESIDNGDITKRLKVISTDGESVIMDFVSPEY